MERQAFGSAGWLSEHLDSLDLFRLPFAPVELDADGGGVVGPLFEVAAVEDLPRDRLGRAEHAADLVGGHARLDLHGIDVGRPGGRRQGQHPQQQENSGAGRHGGKPQRPAADRKPASSWPGARYHSRGIAAVDSRAVSSRPAGSGAFTCNSSASDSGRWYVTTLTSPVRPAFFFASAMASSR